MGRNPAKWEGIPQLIAGIILIIMGVPLAILLLPLGYSIGLLLAAIGAIIVLYSRRKAIMQRINKGSSFGTEIR